MRLGKKKKQADTSPPPPGPAPLPGPGGLPLPPPPGMPHPPQLPTNPPLPTQPLPQQPAIPMQPQHGQQDIPVTPPVQQQSQPAIEALPPVAVPVPNEQIEESQSYSGLYAKKSGKPLKQVYGHIDRISQGEIGSLLDRYSDRFGHELDREIIVMRKGELDDKIAEVRDSPTVELLNQNEEEEEGSLDGETLVELNMQLETVEGELRKLKPEYQAAKTEGDRETLRELRPILEELMAERKLIKSVIAGEADLEELSKEESITESYEEDEDYEDDDEDDDEYDEEDEEESYTAQIAGDGNLFMEFVSIVDALLGSNLPEDKIKEFTESEGFEIYKHVGSDPESSSEEERAEFFSVVDALLGCLTVLYLNL